MTQPSSPEDFREDIEQDVAAGQEFTESAAQEMAPELDAMQSMADTAQEQLSPESNPEVDDAPPPEQPAAAEFAGPSEADVAPPELGAMADMAATAIDLAAPETPPPELRAMEDMAAEVGTVPNLGTQEQQVLQSIPRQQQQQFEMDFGAMESGDVGMEAFEAMSREKDTDFMWRRLTTQMLIDHQHKLEQLLSMLERER